MFGGGRGQQSDDDISRYEHYETQSIRKPSKAEVLLKSAGYGAGLGLFFGSTSGILIGLVAGPKGNKIPTMGRLMRRNGLWFSVIFGVSTVLRSYHQM